MLKETLHKLKENHSRFYCTEIIINIKHFRCRFLYMELVGYEDNI